MLSSNLEQKSLIKFWVAEKYSSCEIDKEYMISTEKHIFVKNVYNGLTYLKKVEIVLKMKRGQAGSQWRAFMRSRIKLMHSFWLYVEKISEQLGISVNTAQKIAHDDLAFGNIKCRWVLWEQYMSLYISNNGANISQLGWKKLPVSPYSKDHSPINFHLFGFHKDFMHGIKLLSMDELKCTVSKWLKTQSIDFHVERIKKLIFR